MADWTYRVHDVLEVPTHLRAEEVGLGSFTFLPHHRAGMAAACTEPFLTSSPATATVTVSVPLTDDLGPPRSADVRLPLRGPGDVLGIDPSQVVRLHPAPGTPDAPPTDLVHIEFDLPDLPWMFTPTGPDHAGHLPPWLRLVVVPDAEHLVHDPLGAGLPPWATVAPEDLPPPEEGWAWAHVQVLGAPSGGGAPSIGDRLSPATPNANLSRVVCPRHLDAERAWRALLVPTFEAGRLAGLGQEPVPDLRWSWRRGAAEPVQLPVYHSWRFSTGEAGDFESLARRLRGVPAPDGVGRRLVSTTHPGLGLHPVATPGARHVSGPLVRPRHGPAEQPAAAPPGAWDDASEEALRARLDHADHVQFDPAADGEPKLAPPLYAGVHLARGDTPDAGQEPVWLRRLNLDPAHRVAAGLGAAVARMDQEDLMTSAWAQLPEVLDANATLRAAQLARFVGDRLHTRHVARLSPGALLAVTQRSHARTLDGEARTTRAAVGSSATPLAAAASPLRRVARAGGPLRRFGATGSDPLLATGDQARDWVRRYAPPDGVHGLGGTARAVLEAMGVADAGGLADRAAVLAEPNALSELARAGHHADLPRGEAAVGDLAGRAAAAVLAVLLDALPTLEDAEALDPGTDEGLGALQRAATIVPQAFGVARTRDEWLLPRSVVERHHLSGDDAGAREGVTVPTPVLADELVMPLWHLLGERGVAEGEPADDPAGGALHSLLETVARETELLLEQLELLYDESFIDTDDLREPARAVLSVGALRIPALLLPRTTIARRVRERIPGLEDHFPGWLANERFDPVMAAPRFTHPMYEALHRHDPEWLLPGVGRIEPHEMVTLLETNEEFVEAFLVGLNHEFARELVWRGYPTDGRATSFRSFWTPRDELTSPVHRLGPGALGSHVSGELRGALVVLVRGDLVRRYPQVLAHVVQQTGPTLPIRYADQPADTLFQVRVGPDLLLVGVHLTTETVDEELDLPGPDGELARIPPNRSWWFTLSEHVGQPRFGLDESPGADGGKRDDLTWTDWTSTGPHLTLAQVPRPDDDTGPQGPRNAADIAWLLFQRPARAGFRVARLLTQVTTAEV
jgi:hypothetical protein